MSAFGGQHTSMAQKSNCTNAWIRDYFETGNLPAPGTVCEVEGNIFGPPTTQTNGPVPVPPAPEGESPEAPRQDE